MRTPVEPSQVFQSRMPAAYTKNFFENCMPATAEGNQALKLENMRLMRENEKLRLDAQQSLPTLPVTRHVAAPSRPEGTWFLPRNSLPGPGMKSVVGSQKKESTLKAKYDADCLFGETLQLAQLLHKCEDKAERQENQSGTFRNAHSFGAEWHSGAATEFKARCQSDWHSATSLDSASTAVLSNLDVLSSSNSDSEGEPSSKRTTLMMRNIPNNYTRDMLLHLLDSEGFWGAYDLVYLPMDFETEVGLGYAFINLRSFDIATQVQEHFQNFSDWSVHSDKVCQMSWSDLHQGLQAHIDRYLNSSVMHSTVPDKFKPVLFKGGVRIAFPSPTKNIRPPRLRKVPSKKC